MKCKVVADVLFWGNTLRPLALSDSALSYSLKMSKRCKITASSPFPPGATPMEGGSPKAMAWSGKNPKPK